MPREIVTSENREEYNDKKMAQRNGKKVKKDAKKEKSYPIAPHGTWYGEQTYAKEGGILRKVSPDDYLKKVAPLNIDEADSRENIDLLKEHIEKGKTLDPLLIRKNGKEDGRHRAYAAKELGIKHIPVIDYGNHFEKHEEWK
jgi:hypothetical protein